MAKYRIIERWTTTENKVYNYIEESPREYVVQYKNLWTILFTSGCWCDAFLPFETKEDAYKALNNHLKEESAKKKVNFKVIHEVK